jgi:hypothetical protein
MGYKIRLEINLCRFGEHILVFSLRFYTLSVALI